MKPDSLAKALAEFKTIPKTILEKEAPVSKEAALVKREIASVEEAPMPKKGEITFIKTNRAPASVETKRPSKISSGTKYGAAQLG